MKFNGEMTAGIKNITDYNFSITS